MNDRRKRLGHAGGVIGSTMLFIVSGVLATSRLYAQRDDVADSRRDAIARTTAEILSRRISLRAANLSLKHAIDTVASVGHVSISYKVSLVDSYSDLVSLSADHMPLGEVFERVLAKTPLRVVGAANGTLLVVASDSTPVADVTSGGTISGRVVDSASGKGLSGATIKIAGTKRGVVTQSNGQFVLRDVPVGEQILTVKLFGHRPVERTVDVKDGAAATIRIVMPAVANVLSGVITTATGEQSRRQIGNDITVLNVDSVMKTAPIRSVTDLLETRVPGLTVQRTSGVPGAPSRIRLRGIGGGLLPDSVGASNDPIVVVDGIRIYSNQSTIRDQNLAPVQGVIGTKNSSFPPPSPLDQIDPNSIETIEVFKGPSASAMYGSDAANGVIVITTKKGQPGKTRIDASLSQGIDYMPGFYAPPGYYAFGHGYNGGFGGPQQCLPTQTACHVDSVVRFQALNVERLSIIDRGGRSEASATVSGGSEQMVYSVTGSASSTMGIFKMPDLYQDEYAALYGSTPPQWMKRPSTYNTWGASGQFTAQPATGLRTSFVTSISNSSQRQTSAQLQLSTLAGQYLDTTSIGPATIAEYVAKLTSQTITTNYALQADWTRWNNAQLGAQVGTSKADRSDRSVVPYGILGPTASKSCLYADTLGCYGLGHGLATTQTVNANARLFSGHRVSAALGLNLTKSSTDDYQASADHLQAGVATPTLFDHAGQSSTSNTTAGWFFEPNFNFGSRFFILPGYRLDGGSASGNRGGVNGGLFALFPKVQLSWIAIDREGSTPLAGVLTFLRPRFAFGVAGVQPDPSWKLRLANNGNSAFPMPGLVLSTLGNTEIHPERSREVEGGFEAELWGQGLTLTATYFNKMRFDAISQLPVAPSVYGGSLGYHVNIGKVRNTGVEIQATANLVHTSTVAWQVQGSVSTDHNELVTLNGRQPYIDLGDGTRLVPGYPLAGRWARPILGYRDPGPDGRLIATDIQIGDSAIYMGAEFPNFTMPFSTSLSLWQGRVALNATFEYQDGKTQLNSGNSLLLQTILANPNTPLGQQAAALAAGITDYGLIQKVNTLRFNSLSASYTIPSALSRRIRVPRMSVSVQGSNLALWTNYRGKDPNVNATTVGDISEDSGQIPQPRSWSLRVNLGN